jgi:hypothetical protein
MRALISKRTKEAMARPEVRAKIQAGMVRAGAAYTASERELVALRSAWTGASQQARALFVAELLAPMLGRISA